AGGPEGISISFEDVHQAHVSRPQERFPALQNSAVHFERLSMVAVAGLQEGVLGVAEELLLVLDSKSARERSAGDPTRQAGGPMHGVIKEVEGPDNELFDVLPQRAVVSVLL